MKRVTVMWEGRLDGRGNACRECVTEASLVAHQGGSIGRLRAEAMDAAVPCQRCMRGGKCKPRGSHYFLAGGQRVEPSEMEHQHAGAGRPVGDLVRDRAVTVRLTESEWEQVHAEAARRDLSISTAVRVLAMERLG